MEKKLRKNWILGFLGFMSLIAIPQYNINGWIGLSWGLWVVWFIYFIPIKKN
jgi:hypothetical protein